MSDDVADRAEEYLIGHDYGAEIGESFGRWVAKELEPRIVAAAGAGVPVGLVLETVAGHLRTFSDALDPTSDGPEVSDGRRGGG